MQNHKKFMKMLALTFAIGSLLFLFGCGSAATQTGNGGTTEGAVVISGTAVKGPVSGATVTTYAISNGAMDAALASGMTDSQGNFTMSISGYSGPVMLRMSGGTYTDEATGSTMSMSSGNMMSTCVPSVATGAATTGIQMTPLTSMSQAMAGNMSSGMTTANITAANTAVGNYFLVNDIVHTQPMNPLVSGSSAAASRDAKNYGMTIAAMSQYAKDSGMSSSSSMVAAMTDDASDGVMNGMMGGTQIAMGGMSSGGTGTTGMGGGTMMSSTAGTSDLATAMTNFMGSAMNKSGLTASDMQTLMDRLSISNGTIQ